MGWHEENSRYSYDNRAGQAVYWVDGATVYAAPGNPVKRFLVVHHTAGVDSRAYLKTNARRVSTHYLIGAYDDNPVRKVYKYALEKTQCTNTQGNGSIGGFLGGNLNDVCVSIEIEGPPISYELMRDAAKLARSILDGWRDDGHVLLMVRHRDIDRNKSDPALDWNVFCQMTYGPQS